MIRPMPRDILIHSVTYEEYIKKGREGDEFKEPITLDNVLVQPVSSLKRSSLSVDKTFESLLFFDCVNSRPTDIVFVKDSRITFNSEIMYISEVQPIYTFNLHHYELELI